MEKKSLKFWLETKLEQWLDFFPLIIMISEGYFILKLLLTHEMKFLFLALLFPYVVPLLFFHFINQFYPLRDDQYYIGEGGYPPWLGAYKIQLIFNTFTVMERILVLLGLYSVWLRLWGSKIGKNILWTPHIQIIDRTSVHIGNNCFFGHPVYLSPHMAQMRKGRLLLVLKTIKIGDNVFIGGYTRIGPGAEIESGTRVPGDSDIYIGQKINNQSFTDKNIDPEEEAVKIFLSRS